MRRPKRVLLGMSGGLDSTYAAKLLIDAGYEVEGALLVMHDFTDTAAAEEAARETGIALHVIDCREEFRRTVIENFLDEYVAARTPNPCIICNRDVKFKFLYEFMKENGFDMMATGHYAGIKEIETDEGMLYAVCCAEDKGKDQTYMLWRLSQEQLSHLLFPLTMLSKSEVRTLAKDAGLSAADRSDSQEICFIPNGDYASFVEERRGISPRGNFVDKEGKALGAHLGLIRYTVGQRKGLGISLGQRAFVTDINPLSNEITLETEPRKSEVVRISGLIFSGMKRPQDNEEHRLFVKLRYQAPPVSARVIFASNSTAVLYLDEPAKSVTPGQSAVLYKDGFVVAGGFIDGAE